MFKRLFIILALLSIIFHPQIIRGDSKKYIEIFDPEEDKVVKKIELTKEINDMVTNWIKEIDEIYPAINPIKDNGFAARFPLDPAIEVENKWLNTRVEEVYLVVPKEDPAFFVVFEKHNKPMFFLFPGKIDELSNILGFQLK